MNGRCFPYVTPIETRYHEHIRIRLGNIMHDTHPIHIHGHQFYVTAADGNAMATNNCEELKKPGVYFFTVGCAILDSCFSSRDYIYLMQFEFEAWHTSCSNNNRKAGISQNNFREGVHMSGMQVINGSMPGNCGMQGMHENSRMNPKAEQQVVTKRSKRKVRLKYETKPSETKSMYKFKKRKLARFLRNLVGENEKAEILNKGR